MTRRLMAGLMLGALVALPLACGDDDTSSSDSTEAAASDSTEADATDETDAPDDTGTPPPDDTTPDGTEADVADQEVTGGDLDRWCEVSADLNDTTALDDAEDPAAIEAAYNDVAAHFDEYLDAAPDQIRDDAETVVGSIRDLRELLEAHDWDANAIGTDPAFQDIFTTEVQEAGTRVDEFEIANCP